MDRIAGIVRQLLEFSRRREPAFRAIDVSTLLKKVTALLQHKITEKHVGVKIEPVNALPSIRADPDLMQQVFINLFLNSLHALSAGGTIKISCAVSRNPEEAAHDDGAPWLRIVFEDNGSGIAPEHLEQVFDPFFTTKDIGEGTGLGLSVTYGIIKDHGGDIRVESQAGKFTRFVIFLPMDGLGPPREISPTTL
jgi:signal transduction histidine kinase